MDIVYKWICLLSWISFSKPDIGFKLGYMINRLFQVFSTWGFWSRKTPKKWGLHQQQKTVSYATENPNVNGNIFHGSIIFNRYTWTKIPEMNLRHAFQESSSCTWLLYGEKTQPWSTHSGKNRRVVSMTMTFHIDTHIYWAWSRPLSSSWQWQFDMICP